MCCFVLVSFSRISSFNEMTGANADGASLPNKYFTSDTGTNCDCDTMMIFACVNVNADDR